MDTSETTRPVVSYHGFGETYSKRLQVLIDGRSVYLPSFGGVHWTDLALAIEDIEKIEIIRGPNTASYGANAFLAIINIHTTAPSDQHGNYVKTLYSTHNDKKFIARHAGNNGNVNYRTTISYDRDPGQSINTDIFGITRDYNDDIHRATVDARLDYRITANDILITKAGFIDENKGIGTAEQQELQRDQEVKAHYQQIKWERKLGNNEEFYIQFFHNYNSQDEPFINRESGVGVPINYDMEVDRYDLEFQHRFKPARSVNLVWGVNLRHDSSNSETYFRTLDPVFKQKRIFSNIEWYVNDSLSYNVGGMVENNNFTGTDASPRIALNYTFLPRHSIRAIYSRAIRVPSAIEEEADATICIDYPDFNCVTSFPFLVGSKDLVPEEIKSRELGYHYNMGRKSSIDIKLYNDAISDLTTVDTGVSPRTILNTDDVTIKGAELQADIFFGKNTRMFTAYAYTDMEGNNVNEEFDKSSPRNTFSLLLIHKFPNNLTGSVAMYRMSEHKPLDGNEISKIERYDLKISKKFRLNNLKGNISLVGQSLTGNYVQYNTDTIFESRAYVTLELFDF